MKLCKWGLKLYIHRHMVISINKYIQRNNPKNLAFAHGFIETLSEHVKIMTTTQHAYHSPGMRTLLSMSLRYYLKYQHERMPLPIFFAGTVSSCAILYYLHCLISIYLQILYIKIVTCNKESPQNRLMM